MPLPQLSGCQSSSECQAPAQCVKIAGGVSYCACPTGYQPDPSGSGRCVDVDECRVSFPKACGEGAVCTNTQGSYTCQCPDGLSGDPSVGVCLPIRTACVTSAQCQENEQCQRGSCICSPPFYVDQFDSNRCKSPCDRFSCGLNAECTPSNPPQVGRN